MQIVIHTFHRLFHRLAAFISPVEICRLHKLYKISELLATIYVEFTA